jgi:HK97 family phage prohead protease
MPEWLRVKLEDKAVSDSGDGEITGLASTYGNVDLQDDVMEPGALAKTVADWMSPLTKARVPLLDWHGDSLNKLIGSVKELKSTRAGLWFRAGFSSDPESQRARQLAKDGHLSGVSIGYLPVRESYKTVNGKNVRALHEVKLLEISLTPVPANPQAQLASVKSASDRGEGTPADLEFGAWADSMTRALAISYEPARKAAAVILLGAWHPPTDAAGSPDEEPTADAAAPEGTAETKDASDYALGFLTPSGPSDGTPEGDPVAYPQQLLESARAQADLDALEAQINQALRRD